MFVSSKISFEIFVKSFSLLFHKCLNFNIVETSQKIQKRALDDHKRILNYYELKKCS